MRHFVDRAFPPERLTIARGPGHRKARQNEIRIYLYPGLLREDPNAGRRPRVVEGNPLYTWLARFARHLVAPDGIFFEEIPRRRDRPAGRR